jgi:signal transduction histidine kinase
VTHLEDPKLVALRATVLSRAIAVLAVTAPLMSVVMLVQLRYEGRRIDDAFVLAPSAFTLLFPLLRVVRLSPVTRSFAFLALLCATAFILQARGGLSFSSAALSLLVVLLACIFFGMRGAIFGVAAVVATLALAGAAVFGGMVAPVEPMLWDPMRLGTWLRSGIALALLGGAGAMTVAYVVAQLEAEARLLRAALEREAEERAARERAEQARELEREQRELAQRELEQARSLEAMGRLAVGVAHDFNNALTVITNSAHMAARQRGLPAAAATCVADIAQAADHAAQLSQQLLALARKDVSKPVRLLPSALLERLEPTLRRILPSDIAIDVRAQASRAIAIDPAQLERALLNLVVNARDAMPRGGRLEIGCRDADATEPSAGAQQGPQLAIWVCDSGDGMDSATCERIFEPFFTTKALGRGTGLGLSLVKGLVLDQGGSIAVDSAPGRGTTFTLWLPAMQGPVAGARDSAPTAEADQCLHGRSLLVVEDHPGVRASMEIILAMQGAAVHSAADGDHAIALLEDPGFTCDLLCIDGVIPGVSSARVIDRALSRASRPGILVCSGYVEEELVRRGIDAGEYAFLQKPFAPDQLVAQINAELRRPR